MIPALAASSWYRSTRDAAAVSPEVAERVRALYDALQKAGIEALWDDRELGPGAKLTDSELLGIPVRVVISERTLATQEAEILTRNFAREAGAKALDRDQRQDHKGQRNQRCHRREN